MSKVSIEIVKGVEGDCLTICDQSGSGKRVAGPKPWGGGTTVKKFLVDVDDLLKAIEENKFEPVEKKL